MLLKDDALVEKYISKHGEIISIAFIKEIKESAETASIINEISKIEVKPLEPETSKIGEDPIYETTLICPVCKNKNVKCYNLKAKSQFVTETHFLVPVYAGVGKFHRENFTLLATTVCNTCLFASPDPKDFGKFIEYTEKYQESQLKIHNKLLFHLVDTTQDRIRLIQSQGMQPSQFNRPRTIDIAITAIKLSILRAELEHEHDLRNTLFKKGAYYLKIAQIEKDAGRDNLNSLIEAEKAMEQAVVDSDCETFELEMEALYLTIALNIKLKNKDKITGYMRILKDIEIEVSEEYKQNPTLLKYKQKFATMEQWEKCAKTALEYRDDESYWATV